MLYQREGSRERGFSTGYKKHSVFPEPVPLVTTTLCACPGVESFNIVQLSC